MNNYRRRTSNASLPANALVSGSLAQALDVVFSTKSGSEIGIVHGEENWPDGCIPIGIVVVPGTHNRYEDGTCGIMALKFNNLSNPENGGEYNHGVCYFGHYNSSFYSNYTNYGFCSNTLMPGYTGTDGGRKQLPKLFRYDNGTLFFAYLYGNNYDKWLEGWPYEGTVASNYTDILSQSNVPRGRYYLYNTSLVKNSTSNNSGHFVYSTSGYAMYDFNGIRNTAAILYDRNIRDAFATPIPNTYNYSDRSMPALNAAIRYKTIGTDSFLDVYSDYFNNMSIHLSDVTNYGTPLSSKQNTGFWYLPALGELSYISAILNDLMEVCHKLALKYNTANSASPSIREYVTLDKGARKLESPGVFWSSTMGDVSRYNTVWVTGSAANNGCTVNAASTSGGQALSISFMRL